MAKTKNPNVYINSFEGEEVYNHAVRGMRIYENYAGMSPYSLELIKLQSLKNDEGKKAFKVNTNKSTGKQRSRDIINIKFKRKARSGIYLLAHLNTDKADKKMAQLKIELNQLNEKEILTEKEQRKKTSIENKILKEESYITYITELKKKINSELGSDVTKTIKWIEKSGENLRDYLYDNDFTIDYVDVKTSKDVKTGKTVKTIKTESITYRVYKRSSSKSRVGQVLAINVNLYQEMINWSLMNLDIPMDIKTDYAGILSYMSLVGSAIEKTIKINPKNILIVNDVDSKFKRLCNVIKSKKPKINKELFNKIQKQTDKKSFDTNIKKGFYYLDSFVEEYMVKNSLFDGESLLQSYYFEEGQSMMLLRQHFFKSASFSTDIQQWLKDYAEEHNINFNTWTINNMFNQPILAKNIHMICTPTSLKALKSSLKLNTVKTLDGQKELKTMEDVWNYWKEIIKSEGSIFGVCKHEKPSKRGFDDDDNILQQSSYQQLNSIPFEFSDILSISEFEKKYIEQLRDDDEIFIEYLKQKACISNANNMFVALYYKNKDIVDTEMFRTFRTRQIHEYKKHVKRGKTRMIGDYCVVLGNPIEYLYHSVRALPIDDNNIIDYKKWKDNMLLKDNEIYTTLFKDDEDDNELICFRNPHTSPSNSLLAKNKVVSEIDTYFNLTKNIVVVNAINFEIQDIASSMDYDSDSLLVFKNEGLKETIKNKVWGQYRVCINNIDSTPKQYFPTRKSMFEIDKELAKSSMNIGEVVNYAQWAMSIYYNEYHKGDKADKNKMMELLKIVDVGTVLSCVAIDLAKKFYNIDIGAEIDHIEGTIKNNYIKEFEDKFPLFFLYVKENKKNKKHKKKKKEKKMKDRITKYETSMDYLVEIINSIERKTYEHRILLSNLLITKNIKKADRDQKNKIKTETDEMLDQINHIHGIYQDKTDEDDTKERDRIIEDTIVEYIHRINKKTINANTMYAILTTFESDTQIRLFNVLYNTSTNKETFLNAFKEN